MKYLFILLAALALQGCASLGGEDKFSAKYLQQNVVVKKTTKADIQRMYGVPDGQKTSSDGSSSWSYYRGSNMDLARNLASYIPGGGAISGALGTASAASSTADMASEASDKISGNTEHNKSYSLWFYFDAQGVVDHWSL